MSVLNKRNYALLSSYLFFYFMAQAASISLLAIWFTKSLGLTGAQVGIIFSANFAVALISQPIYGFVSDKVGLRKQVLWTVALLCMGCGFFFSYLYAPLLQWNIVIGAIVGGVYLGVTFIAGSYAIESYVDRVGRKYGFEYSRARLWGSLGFASMAYFSGDLFNFNPGINFYVASAAGLMLVPILFLLKVEASADEKFSADSLNFRDALAVLRMPKFWGFMVLIVGVTDLYLVYDQQFPAYFASLFPDPKVGTAMFGRLNSAQIFVEAGMMFIAPIIVRRIGAKNGLILAATIMIFRIGGSGFAVGPMSISSMKMLHSLELPIMVVSVFRYIAAHFAPRLASTLYMVGFSFGHSLGLAVLSPFVGRAYDKFGFPNTYIGIALFATFFLILSCFTLSATPPETRGKPKAPSDKADKELQDERDRDGATLISTPVAGIEH